MKKILTPIIFVFLLILAFSESQAAWRQNFNMPSDFINKTYLDVFFLPSNPQYGWICGFESRILRTTNGGKSWQGMRVDSVISQNIQLESIHFVNEIIGYASGPDLSFPGNNVSYLLKSLDGGVTWKSVTPPGATNLWGTYFVDENIGFVVGGGCLDSQMFWKTTDGGADWKYVRYFEPLSKMSDIIVYPDGTGFGAGSGALWFTTDMGESWAILSRTGDIDWHEEITHRGLTHFLPYSKGCDGDNSIGYGGVAYTTDGGDTWNRYSTQEPMYGTFLHDEKRGWGAGFNRAVIYTEDGGENWVYDNCGIPAGANLDDIWFIDDTTGWVVGDGVYEYFVPIYPKPFITALTDTVICKGQAVILTLDEEYERIQWSTGEFGKTIYATEEGEYYATIFVDSICYVGVTNTIRVSHFPRTDFALSVAGNKIPCEGDSVEISISGILNSHRWDDGTSTPTFTVTGSGTYYVTVVDTNNCVYSDSIQIQFNPLPEPTIELSRTRNICIGDTITLYASDGHVDYYWYKDDDTEHFSREKSVIVSESGLYYVVATNEFGCPGISNKIDVFFRDETDALEFSFALANEFEIDTTHYQKVRCGVLEITNLLDESVVLNDLYFFRNIAFSSPLTQFPIIIGANSTEQVKVCFSPLVLGFDRDTILIVDNCSDRIIKLVSYGTMSNASSNSRCDVPLYFTPLELGGKYLYISDAYPNPASSMVSLDYQYEEDSNSKSMIQASVTDIYGNDLASGNIDVEFEVTDEEGYFSLGKIKFDTSHLNTGFYFIKVITNYHIELRKVMISK
ncbi:MAG: YCF48-related protein [Candidatus Kapabacteria bacterium]|nr:YCF48-related protein [Candidatus Kapabacteria bacterium]